MKERRYRGQERDKERSRDECVCVCVCVCVKSTDLEQKLVPHDPLYRLD